ncbi:hypothetical protein HDU85_006016 [Gaertneriomyces sp. JEL0708]|nr:hypothetical protein BC832DRAFT_591658 [Gaertneriomyces semiglobifer]KAJ3177090.1 hypothetical protein HDU85_006016 [Gaertneriomyces sp. JEL0708]
MSTPPSGTRPTSTEDWLLLRIGTLPRTSLGWFRTGIAFYNKKDFPKSIECLEKATELDPMNYNAWQVLARACIAVNRREEAVEALKRSVALDNPSDWQLLVELTANKE